MEDVQVVLLVTGGEIGGAQTSVLTLATALRKRGVRVGVGHGQNGSFLARELKRENIPTVVFPHLTRTNNPIKNLWFTFEFRSFLKKNPQITVVHCNSSNTLFAALAAKMVSPKRGVVFTFRGLSYLEPSYSFSEIPFWFFKKRVYKLFFRFFMKFVDEGVFVSKRNMETCPEIGLLKKSLIYNAPLKTTFMPRDEARDFLATQGVALERYPYLIGSIGRFASPKHYEQIIEDMPRIIEQHPDALLVLIGSGPYQELYEKLILKYNLLGRVFLLGEISGAARYLRAFDVFVLPTGYEGLSLSLLEARAAGLPIIATDVGGNSEVVEDFAGVYPFEDTNRDSSYFLNLLQKLRRTSRSVENSLSEKFTPEYIASEYIALYKKYDSSISY